MAAQNAVGGQVRTRVARPDAAFPWYVGAALVLAVGGGFALAVALPLAAAFSWEWGVRWPALAQAHGHLQVLGWVGLFIAGMAFRLTPRFAGRPLRFPALTSPTLLLLLVGMLGRAVAQPWLELPGMRALLTLSAVAEFGGAILFAAVLSGTLLPVLHTLPVAPLLLLGAASLVAQSALGALWLVPLSGTLPVIPAARNETLLSLQFFAFVLPFVLGVSLRSLPTFFAMPAPTPARAQALAVLLGMGALLHAGAAPLVGGAPGVRVQQFGALLLAVALLEAVRLTGVWREPARLRASARAPVLLIRAAYLWLVVAAIWLATGAAVALPDGEPLPSFWMDALRHVLALGVVTMLILGMAQLLLPWLAMRRQRQADARREIWTLWTLLTGATVLRVLGALLAAGDAGTARHGLMAAGGLLGLTAIAFFAVAVLRAAHAPPPEIAVHERST